MANPVMSPFQKVKVGVIGAGRAGLTIANHFVVEGHSVLLWDLGEDSKRQIVEHFGSQALVEESLLITQVQWLVIAVPDSGIRGWLVQFMNKPCPENLLGIIHLSGSLGIEVFDGIPDNIGRVALHPMRAFAAPDYSAAALENTYFGLTASSTMVSEQLANLLPALSNRFLNISQDKRAVYHMAAVMASNFIVPLIIDAKNLYRSCGIGEETAEQLVATLVLSTVTNFLNLPDDQVLTGPLVRGDIETVKKHLAALSEFPNQRQRYLELVEMTLEQARVRIDENTYLKFKELIRQSKREVNL